MSRFRFIFIANQNERDGHAKENEKQKKTVEMSVREKLACKAQRPNKNKA